MISSVPLPQGQDKSVTLRVTRWPDLFSPLQSLSMTLNFPASFLLSSLADVIYCSEMNREASLGPQEGHSPTGIRPQFCGNRAASFLHAAGLQRTGVQRIPAEATKGAALEWKEEKWKKTKKEKKTHIDYPEEKTTICYHLIVLQQRLHAIALKVLI